MLVSFDGKRRLRLVPLIIHQLAADWTAIQADLGKTWKTRRSYEGHHTLRLDFTSSISIHLSLL